MAQHQSRGGKWAKVLVLVPGEKIFNLNGLTNESDWVGKKAQPRPSHKPNLKSPSGYGTKEKQDHAPTGFFLDRYVC
ncbi:hypothetical protein X474_08265 [Dethiosulfatarculus sandiegensis]|uniref:Uncharacterized protein n=1 Tax=Dethiosulfatarculus sandiegensis TaxID=1429043 RepID=A0A0D2JG15_9BACT|nr:hypothetical protein X474_08265 [Dethiosulfatarculus sandiegensis]